MASDKVYRQIEARADKHPPKVYDLLTFHNSMFDRAADSLSTQYVPLTGAKLPSGTQAIPFVVGILAPSAEISGNVLDRSASVGGADVYSALTQAEIEAMGLADLGGVADGGGGGGFSSGGTSGYNPLLEVSSLSPQQAAAFKRALAGVGAGDAKDWADFLVGAGKANGVSPFILAAIMHEESGYGVGIGGSMKGCRPGGKNLETVCKGSDKHGFGLMQIDDRTPLNAEWLAKTVVSGEAEIPIYADPRSIIYYAAQLQGQTKKAVKKGLPGASAELRLRSEIASYNAGYPRVIKQVRAGVAPESLTYRPNYVEGVLAEALRLIRAAGLTAEAAKPVARDSAPDESRGKKGSKAAKKAAVVRATEARRNVTGRDLNNSEIGSLYQTAQRNIINALQLAQEQMAATPPLRLIINPQSFSVANSKIISDGNWGRNGPGPTIEHWGDAQDVISAQGKVAGFYASLKTSDESLNNAGSPGLTRMARAFSESYQNLMSLYLLYRNNGGLWTEDFSETRAITTKPNNLALVGSVYIYYDNTMYIGSFDSFELTEEAESPFTLSYSFEFTVRATYLLEREGIEVGTDPNKAYSTATPLTAYTPGERVRPTPVVVETVPPAQPSGATVTDTGARTFLETSEELGSRRGFRGSL